MISENVQVTRLLALGVVMAVTSRPVLAASCETEVSSQNPRMASSAADSVSAPVEDTAAIDRVFRYAAEARKHRMVGLASYYSTSLDGTLTANGEIYRNKRVSAAHLTLPLGSWVEVRSKATGKRIRLRVNDRGPYVTKFVIDLSQAAARSIGVDMTEDRTVNIRFLALPGETPSREAVEPAGLNARCEEESATAEP
jgi:rare lipoprotein A